MCLRPARPQQLNKSSKPHRSALTDAVARLSPIHRLRAHSGHAGEQVNTEKPVHGHIMGRGA